MSEYRWDDRAYIAQDGSSAASAFDLIREENEDLPVLRNKKVAYQPNKVV